MNYKRVKGCYDIHTGADDAWREPLLWNTVESAARDVAFRYALSEIRTPVFEHTDVFLRSVGETSDIVSKEMYSFLDKASRSLTLRPELTAPVIRAFIENSLHQKGVNRLFYIGPCWRYDRAQKGRYRQFNQFGIELIGSHDVSTDIEAISALLEFYRIVGLKNLTLLINSIGDQSVRTTFSSALQEHFTPLKEKLSEDSQRRLIENPMRIIDSKAPEDIALVRNAPNISSFLTQKQKDHFSALCGILDELKIPYKIDYNLVRGLDYYCDTVFEVVANDDSAAQNTLGAGGRYDNLIAQMGGPDLPGIGFATGIERVIQNLLSQQNEPVFNEGPEFILIGLSEKCKKYLLPHLFTLRQRKHSSLLYQGGSNIKKALAYAEKIQAEYAVILGDEELNNSKIKIKHLSTREEMEHPISYLNEISKRIPT